VAAGTIAGAKGSRLVREALCGGIGLLGDHGMDGMLYKKTESREMLRRPSTGS
jgi:hypothetical protein